MNAPTPASRLPLWLAMSDLFLDTETQPYIYPHIAREIIAAGLSLADAEAVFWNEVYPALWTNLLSITGVWDGFDPDWLQRTLRVSLRRKPRKRWCPMVASKMRLEWGQVEAAYRSMQ